MYADDHNPPHFHARHAGEWIQVSIETLEVLRGELPAPQLRRVLEWARANQDVLRARWDSLQ